METFTHKPLWEPSRCEEGKVGINLKTDRFGAEMAPLSQNSV